MVRGSGRQADHLAQLAEREAFNLVVVGSSPTVGIAFFVVGVAVCCQSHAGAGKGCSLLVRGTEAWTVGERVHTWHAGPALPIPVVLGLRVLTRQQFGRGASRAESTKAGYGKSEARGIRTPNLLNWSQTRCRCAIAPVPSAVQIATMYVYRARACSLKEYFALAIRGTGATNREVGYIYIYIGIYGCARGSRSVSFACGGCPGRGRLFVADNNNNKTAVCLRMYVCLPAVVAWGLIGINKMLHGHTQARHVLHSTALPSLCQLPATELLLVGGGSVCSTGVSPGACLRLLID